MSKHPQGCQHCARVRALASDYREAPRAQRDPMPVAQQFPGRRIEFEFPEQILHGV